MFITASHHQHFLFLRLVLLPRFVHRQVLFLFLRLHFRTLISCRLFHDVHFRHDLFFRFNRSAGVFLFQLRQNRTIHFVQRQADHRIDRQRLVLPVFLVKLKNTARLDIEPPGNRIYRFALLHLMIIKIFIHPDKRLHIRDSQHLIQAKGIVFLIVQCFQLVHVHPISLTDSI